MDTIYLLPGEERCVDFRDANGVPKVHYTYCSIRGKLFNCTCCTKDEAQRLCEDWLIKQDRCYINEKAAEDTSTMGRVLGGIRLSGVLQSENVLLYSFLSASTIFSEGWYKNIQIDQLCDKGMLFCNSPKISFFLNYSWPIACFAASIPKV